MKYLAFVLNRSSREAVLRTFSPSFDNVICHHVTIMSEFHDRDHKFLSQLLMSSPRFFIYGSAMSDHVDACAVMMNKDVIRPDGVFYHLTVSVTPGHRAAEAKGLKDSVELRRGPPIEIFGSIQILERK